jgi:hypothetical protein
MNSACSSSSAPSVKTSSNWSTRIAAGASPGGSRPRAAASSADGRSPGQSAVERQGSDPARTPVSSAGSSPARSSDDFPLPDGPTTATRLASETRATSSATRRSRPKKLSASAASKPIGAAWGRRARGRVEPWVLVEDGGLEAPQLGPRLDAQFVDECAAGALVGVQRLPLAARAVEGDHQLSPAPLSERLLAHRLLELGHEIPGATARQLGVDAVLEGVETKAVEPGGLRRAPLDVCVVGVGGPAPLREGGAQVGRGADMVALRQEPAPERASCSNRPASTCSGSLANRYPRPTVSITAGAPSWPGGASRARRSRAM